MGYGEDGGGENGGSVGWDKGGAGCEVALLLS